MHIVVRQVSGLGNQLFQYAAGRYFSRRYRAVLRIATDLPRNAMSHGYRRPFLLSNFEISAKMKPLSRWERTLFSTRPLLKPVTAPLTHALGIQVFTEPIKQRYTFIEDLPLVNNLRTLYLAGYWQAYGFVEQDGDGLRADLKLKAPPTGRNQDVLDQIYASGNAVSIHVRRGDYTLAAEGNIALPMDYYKRAIAYFQERLARPSFFVFSDDIAFARANLSGIERTIFVDHNDDDSSHEDLRLMSACRNHIIANSSFSWWGAWLNPKPDKIVFAPKHWHLTRESYYPALLPPAWELG